MEDQIKKWYENPLFLPEGSVRALITFLLLGSSCYLLYLGYDMPDWVIAADGTAIGFYFGGKIK